VIKIRKFISSLLAMTLAISSGLPIFAEVTGTVTSQDGYAWPDAQPITNANEHGLDIGELNEDKTIIKSSELTITGLPNSRYAVAYDEVTVHRLGYDGKVKQTIIGEALSFADKNKTADNGWVMVDVNEAKQWIEVFNGDPAHVLGGTTIYSHTITNILNGRSYQAYNLADIAEASGGRGKDFGFKQVQGKWKNYTTYEATPRPTGWVATNKSTYTFNETAQITAGGKDNSIYDNGIDSISLTVVNKTTNKGYVQQVNTNTMSYLIKPEYGTGEYEVSYIMTDKHSRTPPDSPDMSTSAPIKTTFTVVNDVVCDPATAGTKATISISGGPSTTQSSGGEYQLPQGKNTASITFPKPGSFKVNGVEVGTNTTKLENLLVDGTKMIYYVSTDGTECWTKQIKPPTVVAPTCDPNSSTLELSVFSDEMDTMNLKSGGTAYPLDYGTSKLTFEMTQANIGMKGTFYKSEDGGKTFSIVAGPEAGSASVGVRADDRFIIKFVSEDESKCWQREFYVESSGEVNCPTYHLDSKNGEEIENGTTLYLGLNDSLDIWSKVNVDGTDEPQSNVWRIKKPGDPREYYMDVVYDSGDAREANTNHLHLPSPTNYDKEDKVAFDKPGRYEIYVDYTRPGGTSSQYAEAGCSWGITVIVESAIDCSEYKIANSYLDGKVVTLTPNPKPGDAEQSIERFSLEIPFDGKEHNADFHMTYKGLPEPSDYIQRLYNGKGGWSGWSSGTAQTVARINFPEWSTPAYTSEIKITSTKKGVTCIKIIEVSYAKPKCEDVTYDILVNSNSYTPSEGDGSQANPYVIKVRQNQSNALKITAKLNGSTSGFTPKWSWNKQGTNTYTNSTDNPFAKTIYETTDAVSYNLKATVSLAGEDCLKYFKIVVSPISCEEVYMHMWDSAGPDEWEMVKRNLQKGIIDHGTLHVKFVITDSPTDAVSNRIKVKWEVPFANQSATPLTMLENKNLNTGKYTIKGVIQDPAYPSLNGCEIAITLEYANLDAGCETIYVHMYDTERGWIHNVNKTTQVINADKVSELGFYLNQKKDDHRGIGVVNAKWTVSPYLKKEASIDTLLFKAANVPKGTYTFTAVVNDESMPNAQGCTYTFTVVIGQASPPPPPQGPPVCTNCEPGGNENGGSMKLRVYDSGNRLLTSTDDGVWEKEPARIEVEIDQGKIDRAFVQIDSEINKAINDKKQEFLDKYSGPGYEKVVVVPNPPSWDAKNNPKTKWPSSVQLIITGPGTPATFTLNPKQQTQSHTYKGTSVPTETTWELLLNSQNYEATIADFEIAVPYEVNFAVTYNKCEMKPDPSHIPDPDDPDAPVPQVKVCTPGTDSATISNQYGIKVDGAKTTFEVFEPNAKGVLSHTAEWSEYHSRDRYAGSKPNDFYAGERILTRVELEDRHRHPFSKKFPQIVSATAWISETGQKGTLLQSQLALVQSTASLWKGPMQMVTKLGMREAGVDTNLMGDKQKGFQKGSNYAVHFYVQFAFGVNKGFLYPTKSTSSGHETSDYKTIIKIIANAWERQGIRNHTKH